MKPATNAEGIGPKTFGAAISIVVVQTSMLPGEPELDAITITFVLTLTALIWAVSTNSHNDPNRPV